MKKISLYEGRANDLLYVCCMIEYLRRKFKTKSKLVVNALGEDLIRGIYKYADVYHCMTFESAAEEILEMSNGIEENDVPINLRYGNKPTFTEIGKRYAYIILSYDNLEHIESLLNIYRNEFITELIDDYDLEMYWETTDNLIKCIEANEVLY